MSELLGPPPPLLPAPMLSHLVRNLAASYKQKQKLKPSTSSLSNCLSISLLSFAAERELLRDLQSLPVLPQAHVHQNGVSPTPPGLLLLGRPLVLFLLDLPPEFDMDALTPSLTSVSLPASKLLC